METQDNFEFEINVKMSFDNGEAYVVGYDTMGNGVCFDGNVYVCRTQDELDSEVYRIVDEYYEGESTIEEFLVIAKLETNYKVDYREYQITKIRVR